ncbi:MAG: glutamyl-tRNA reductase [Deltaproteobacteria bacterium]|nr:glutamyl-tRNA reductase [Deltaproteobacteria bacterium]
MKTKVIIVGLNHETAPIELRERVAFANRSMTESLKRLVSLSSIEEGVILSTCNRVEVLAASVEEKTAVQDIKRFLVEQESGEDLDGLEGHLYTYSDQSAVRHLFRVAASLDSMVVGEPQILGQLKEYYFTAREAGTVGTILHRLFHRSFSVAKKVRSETAIARRPVSISSVAVDLAKRIFDNLEDKTVMVIGAGRMGKLVVRHLIQNGVRSVMITNRTFDHAVKLAEEFHASPIRFEDYRRYLKLADVIIGSTESPQFLLGSDTITEVLKERKQKAMFFIDLGDRRNNFDPRINGIDNVYLYNIDHLKDVSKENLKGREGETIRAEEIVDEEVEGFLHWLESLEQVPTIVALKGRFEEIRQKELEKFLGTSLKGLSDRERQALEELTLSMINKILHAPLANLRAQHDNKSVYVEALKKFFNLDEK